MWYKYKNYLINFENVYRIASGIHENSIVFLYNPSEWEAIEYSSLEESEAEFEKIIKLLGFKETKDVVFF